MSTDRRYSDTASIASVGDRQFASANDIFIHLSIPQIRKLNNEYKDHVNKAKSDLHSLVGSKYRDLIKISEDIDVMHGLTREVDSRLADLSYKPGKFVNFNNSNPYSKFNSNLRSRQIEFARTNSKKTILNYLINKKLVALDLKLSTSDHLKNAFWLIHYAKLYHAIEYLFQDKLSTDAHLSNRFSKLKNKFVSYLEKELSQYNAPVEDYISSDYNLYSPSHRLSASDILSETHQNIFIENDDLEFLGDDHEFNENDYDDLQDLDLPNASDCINKNSPQFLNYLVAYVIVNHNNSNLNSLSKVTEKLINLRLSYLESLLENVLSSGLRTVHISFFKVLTFIENTCDYIAKFLGGLTTNDFAKSLKQVTASWKISDLLGFHDWFDIEEVGFNRDIYLINLPDSSIKATNELLRKFPSMILQNIEKILSLVGASYDPLLKLSHQFVIFHNFIVNLGKVVVSSASNGKSHNLLRLVTDSGLAQSILNKILSNTECIFDSHFKSLSDKSFSGNIASLIESHLAADKKGKDSGLFSSDMVDLIDTNLNLYIDGIRDSSFSTSFLISDILPIQESCNKIDDWFGIFVSLRRSLETQKPTSLNRQDFTAALAHLIKFLRKDFDELSQGTLKWGSFSYAVVEEKFTSLKTQLSKQFWDNIIAFLDFLSNIIDNISADQDLKNLYSLLHILVTIKEKVLLFDDIESEISQSIDSLVRDVYTKFFSAILNLKLKNLTYVESLRDAIITPASPESSTFRPSLRLSSILYQFSANILSLDGQNYSLGYSHSRIFTNKHVKKTFIELKSKWIYEELILPSREHIPINAMKPVSNENSKAKADQNTETESTNVSETEQESMLGESVQSPSINSDAVYANLMYILSFANAEPIDESNESGLEILKEINSSHKTISENDSKAILKGIKEFYKSNKGLYLPFLVC